MPEIAFTRRHCSAADLAGMQSGAIAAFCNINASTTTAQLLPHTPYCLRDEPLGLPIAQRLAALSADERQRLSCCVDLLGDLTVPLAAFYDRYLAFLDLQNVSGLVGAGATAREAGLLLFQSRLRDYQAALLALKAFDGRGRRGSGVAREALLRAVNERFDRLNHQFRSDLARLVPKADLGRNRGTALTSAERGITLTSRRRGRGLYVAHQGHAVQLTGFAKAVSRVGKGAIMLDAGLRVRNVKKTHGHGDNWQREAAIQTTGFGFGGAAALSAGKAVAGGMVSIGLAATPAGWVVMIGVGVAVGFGTGYIGDRFGRGVASSVWDLGR